MATIEIQRKSFDQIKNYPLFFFKRISEWDFDARANVDYYTPESCYAYKDKPNRINDSDFHSSRKIILTYGRIIENPSTEMSDYVTVELEPFNYLNYNHVKAVLSIFMEKKRNPNDKFAAREFIWMLNSYNFDISTLRKVIESFDVQFQTFCFNALKLYSQCLSLPKQSIVKGFLATKNIQYDIYFPSSLKEALSIKFPTIDFYQDNRSIFNLIDLAISNYNRQNNSAQPEAVCTHNPTNFFIQIQKWLNDSSFTFIDFEDLSDFYKLFTPDIQLLLLKRYFHAVREGQTTFDINLVRTLHRNRYEHWGTLYHCACEPNLPIRLAVPLLCDCVSTFLSTNFTTLQTINGTLDLAYERCDTNAPEVDFGLKDFVPICTGGAIPDQNRFLGFICYKITYELKEELFNKDILLDLFRKYLEIFGNQEYEYVCLDENSTVATFSDTHENKTFCQSCQFLKRRGLDKFIVNFGEEDDEIKRTILKLFTNHVFPGASRTIIEPTVSMLDTQEVKRRVKSLFNEKLHKTPSAIIRKINGIELELESGWYANEQAEEIYNFIISDFLRPAWISIQARGNAYIGRGVLNTESGINEEFLRDNNIHSFQEAFNDVRVQQRENALILPRINASLKEQLEVEPDEDGNFYVEYDSDKFLKLKSEYYTHKEIENSTTFDKDNAGFMTSTRSKYDRYCAPQYNSNKNIATHLPFMWCNGKECFKNALADQTLESNKSWKQYTILHILEILGYPQISETEGGNEASEIIRTFIVMVNKASSIFRRVRCRECNHILFAIGGSRFNRYNKFECRLSSCSKRYQLVYISQCHHCKKGVIDSRDTAKCPNGWHICPNCLSCCDSNVYERLASRYIQRGNQIPRGIADRLGNGHNDNGNYFCPKCGGIVEIYTNSQTTEKMGVCQNCRTKFNNM